MIQRETIQTIKLRKNTKVGLNFAPWWQVHSGMAYIQATLFPSSIGCFSWESTNKYIESAETWTGSIIYGPNINLITSKIL